MRATWTLLAACALAACGGADGDTARAAAPADTAPSIVRTDTDSAAARTRAAGDTAYAFRLHEARTGVVDSITVTRGGRPVQTLVPEENMLDAAMGVERVTRPDLDWDGHADLGFVTELSMAGSRSQYWHLDPATGRFQPAGTYETLQPDSAAREWHTFNRGGHAGRLWTASRWRWMNGTLTEVRREAQDLVGDGSYGRVVHEHRGGALTETLRDTLDEDELRGGPSWMEP